MSYSKTFFDVLTLVTLVEHAQMFDARVISNIMNMIQSLMCGMCVCVCMQVLVLFYHFFFAIPVVICQIVPSFSDAHKCSKAMQT